jgi:hypothetical protein
MKLKCAESRGEKTVRSRVLPYLAKVAFHMAASSGLAHRIKPPLFAYPTTALPMSFPEPEVLPLPARPMIATPPLSRSRTLNGSRLVHLNKTASSPPRDLFRRRARRITSRSTRATNAAAASSGSAATRSWNTCQSSSAFSSSSGTFITTPPLPCPAGPPPRFSCQGRNRPPSSPPSAARRGIQSRPPGPVLCR